MSAVAVAVGAGVAGIAGAVITSNAQRDAANTQAGAANNASQTQWNMYEQQRQDQQPWLQAGSKALGDLQTQMPDLQRQFSMADFHEDPGYQFTLNQGLDAMQRSAAAKGMLGSTGTMQGLNNYAQGMASDQYQNAYNRFTQNQNQRYNMLSGIAGTGQVANGQIGQAGMNTANNISANQIGAGNAQSAAQIGSANAWGGALSNGANAWMNGTFMNRMFPSAGGGGGGSNTMGGMAGYQSPTGTGTYFGGSNPYALPITD